jgi:hypothetical protein
MNDATESLGQVVDGVADQIIGFAWIEARWHSALQALERARDLGIRGVKSIPNHWYPTDDCALAPFARMEQLGMPAILHSAILFSFGDSSRFCRPALYEALISTPRVKFALVARQWAIGG